MPQGDEEKRQGEVGREERWREIKERKQRIGKEGERRRGGGKAWLLWVLIIPRSIFREAS